MRRRNLDVRQLTTPDVSAPRHEEPGKENDTHDVCNIGDHVLMESDQRETPNQRFWIGQVMNITLAQNMPDINLEDPDPVLGTNVLFIQSILSGMLFMHAVFYSGAPWWLKICLCPRK